MEERMIDNSRRADAQRLLLRDCLRMDASIAERLHATVEMSVEWAEQALDILIRLDDDLQAFDATVKQSVHSLRVDDGATLPMADLARQTEQSVQRLRDGLRDVMMSMQNQDVMGQSIERAASALEKRIAAIGSAMELLDSRHTGNSEVAEIHRIYRAEDDLHHPTAGKGHDVAA